MTGLVLSLFPGLGFLDRAFEAAGFCVVRGPDTLWGGDVRDFHPPRCFNGIIGGPPCQPFSRLVNMVLANGYKPRHDNLIPEFERVIAEARPAWFLMEEVTAAPIPHVDGYVTRDYRLNNRHFGGEQERVRRISFGTLDGRPLPLAPVALEPHTWEAAVTGDPRRTPVKLTPTGNTKTTHALPKRSIQDILRLQGFPPDLLDDCPLTDSGKRQAIGNGVPFPLGIALANAVRAAFQ